MRKGGQLGPNLTERTSPRKEAQDDQREQPKESGTTQAEGEETLKETETMAQTTTRKSSMTSTEVGTSEQQIKRLIPAPFQ